MAMIEIDYKCDKCGEEFTISVDDYYLTDIPKCPECGLPMSEVGRTQPDPYEVEQDQNERDREY